jgi:hypothetical protein
MEQDEIYLIDMWRLLIRQWRWFVAVLVLVLAATFAYSHTAKPQWEATAWIQIAQIGAAPQGQDPKAEPLGRVIERLQTVAFQNDVLKSAGYAPATREAGLYRGSLKLDPQPYANLIKVSIRAYSPQQANLLATATVTQLQAIHQRIETLPMSLARGRLDEIQADLQTALADRERLLREVAPENKDGNAALAGVLLASRNEAIRDLQQTRSELIYRLSANYTYETSLPWPIYVPDRQAYPNPTLTWGIGILAGLFLGALAAILANLARRRT